MAEALAAAFLQVLVQNLIDVAKNEISTIPNFKKDAAKLTETLVTIQTFLNDAAMRPITGKEEAIKNWITKLENVGFDADNVLDELNYHLMSKKIMPPTVKSQKLKVLQSCFSCFIDNYAFPRKMGLRIKEINDNLESINKEASRYGLSQRLIAHVPTPTAAQSNGFKVDPIFVGRDDLVSKIVKMLGSIRSNDVASSIIAVVGMGGVGKTSLVTKVYTHEKVVSQFGSCIWVHVSQKFDPVVLFKKILNEVTSRQINVECEQEILRELKEALKDKSYLLVLDDDWNDKDMEWGAFIDSLSGVTSPSSKGNAIVVTTRNKDVASIVRPLRTYELKGLSDDDCWSIIKGKTYGEEDVPRELESIGRKIATKCRGLPLAAKVVGGVLYKNKSEEHWLSIEENWLSGDAIDSITKILGLSFDYLSPPILKKCFAYCSIFPKGHKIVKQELVEYWMAEGFLEDDGSNDMESLGNKYVNILLQSSLLQVAKGDEYGDVQLCEMHDHVHDLARNVLGSSQNGSRVRYLSYEDESSPIPKEVAKHLRTLFFKGEISSTVFSDMESLHVLTCNGRGGELPSSIRKLIHLRTLEVSTSSIRALPEWIGELHNLQTLRASHARDLKLPNTLKYLINLRHLYLEDDVQLPAEIGKLVSLRTLLYFPVGDGNNGCKIEELGSLKNLKGKLEIRNLEKVGDKEEAEKANLCQKSKLLELCLEWRWDTRCGVEINDEIVLEGLRPHQNLKKLEIWGFMGKKFPMWIEGLNKLINIRLVDCCKCEDLPMMGHLPNLKSLKVSLNDMKRISSSFYGLVNKDTRIVFPALERLELLGMIELAEWAEVEFDGATEVKVFPRLQHLEITWCEKLMNVPTPRCHTAEFSLLTELCLEKLEQLECLHDGLFYNNPNLSSLVVKGCLKLRKLPDGICTLNSLKELIIEECPNLERIASDPSGGEQSQESFTSLRRIEIRECDVLVCLPHEMVQSSLESLTLTGLSSLSNLPDLIACLPKSPRLTYLCIGGVPQFMANLEIDVTSGWKDTDAYGPQCLGRPGSMDFVDCIFQMYCHSLTGLTWKGLESWECLKSIQHLTALDKLCLENFVMEELPEWIGNLSSLKELIIRDCPNLERIASDPSGGEQSQESFTSLRRIEICDCRVLVCLPCEMVQSSLESLILTGLSSLSNLPDLIACLPKSPRLTYLFIGGIPQFMAKLKIDVTSGWKDIDPYGLQCLGRAGSSSIDFVDFILQIYCHSLTRLVLKGLESWECPESIQHLTALELLYLKNFGMEELPEWFGNLSSLKTLHLVNCKNLRRLPSVDAMRRITTLIIRDCPELRIQSDDGDSEWPKISHIPNRQQW